MNFFMEKRVKRACNQMRITCYEYNLLVFMWYDIFEVEKEKLKNQSFCKATGE